jgi:hypothetical protein
MLQDSQAIAQFKERRVGLPAVKITGQPAGSGR